MKLDQATFDVPVFEPLQQHSHFAAALAGMGRPMTLYDLAGGAVARVLSRPIWPFKRPVQMLSRGPYWPHPPSDLRQYDAICQLRAHNVRIINAETISAKLLQAAGYRQIMTPASIAVMDLRHGPDVRRALMSIKWRNALRKAESINLRVTTRPYHHMADKWILNEDAKQQAAKGYRALPAAVTQAYALMNKDQAVVVTAFNGANPIAAMVFLRHGSAATYHIGWTSAEGRISNAHNLCLTTAMDTLEEQGTAVLDLGAIDTVTAPGLARFKLGAGAQVKTLGGTWLALPGVRPKNPF